MNDIAIVNEAVLRELVPLDLSAIDCVEAAFGSLATEPVVMPPILRLDLLDRRGEVDVKTAYVPRLDSFAIKVSPGFFNNPCLGLPSLNGLMLVLSAKTGLTEAILLDNGYLTAVRTAAAGAVAARWLAKRNAKRAAVIGAGAQARLQLRALALVRDIEEVSVWSVVEREAHQFADEMSEVLGVPCRVALDAHAALASADVAVTTTPSSSPLVQVQDLHPGLHITAMGSDAEHKNEIAPAALAAARYICDRVGQTRVLGELNHAIKAGLVSCETKFPELGEIVAGQVVGRESDADITICDLTGTGVQDTAIATLALARVRVAGRGQTFNNG